MPFVRVLRDKRGYKTTYLMHWFQDAQPPRSSILYVFRSPGGAGVGLDALAPDRREVIEAAWPDIEFQWKSLVKNQQVVEVVPESRRQHRRRRAASGEGTPAKPETTPDQTTRAPQVPAAIEGATREEQLAFLASWHERIRERVPKRWKDPARQEALLALAERINPAAWADADEIDASLPAAAEALERLSKVFAKRRRSRRGSGRSAAVAVKAPGASGTEGVPPAEAPPEVSKQT